MLGWCPVVTSSEVFSSIPLTPQYPAVVGRRGMAAAMHCVCRRNILTPQPFTWSSWCHPHSYHFHFAFGSCHCTNKYSFNGNLSSVVWANGKGHWGHSAGLWVCQALLADPPESYLWHWSLNLWAWQWDIAWMLSHADGVFSCISLDLHVELLALKNFYLL